MNRDIVIIIFNKRLLCFSDAKHLGVSLAAGLKFIFSLHEVKCMFFVALTTFIISMYSVRERANLENTVLMKQCF